MWLFRGYLTGLVEAVVKPFVTRLNSVQTGNVGCLQAYYEVVQFLMKRYAIDDNNTNVDKKVDDLRQGMISLPVFARKLWSRTPTYRSICAEKAIKPMFGDGIQVTISKTLTDCRAEILTQNVKLLLILKGNKGSRTGNVGYQRRSSSKSIKLT